MEAFKVVEKSILQFKTKLTEAERDKKSIEVALQGAERQVENQRKYLRQTKDQLVAAKEHIETLKKELEETEKAVKKAEQDGYEVQIVKIDEALRVEVSEVCRIYCLQLWNEFLNQVEVEASSAFRASSSSSSQADIASKKTDTGKGHPAKALSSSGILPKEVEQPRVVEKEKDTNKGVVLDATRPLAASKDSSKEKKASRTWRLSWLPFLCLPRPQERLTLH